MAPKVYKFLLILSVSLIPGKILVLNQPLNDNTKKTNKNDTKIDNNNSQNVDQHNKNIVEDDQEDLLIIDRYKYPVEFGDLLLEYNCDERPSPKSQQMIIPKLLNEEEEKMAKNILQIHLDVDFLHVEWTAGRYLTVVVYLRQSWTDARLKFNSANNDYIKVPNRYKIWNTDTFIPKALKMVKFDREKLIMLKPDGTVLKSEKLVVKTPCYIVDWSDLISSNGLVNCSIDLQSYEHLATELQFQWHTKKVEEKQRVSRLNNVNFVAYSADVKSTPNGDYSRATITLGIRTGFTKEVLNFVMRKNMEL